MCRTFLGDGFEVSSEILVAISHSEWQQHDIGGRDEGERADRRLTQPTAQRYSLSLRWITQTSFMVALVIINSCRKKGNVWFGTQTHLCRMRPLMGSRASYTTRASFTQSLGSTRNEVTVRRIKAPGAAVSLTWQLTPPHDEKTFKGTLTPWRLAYILSTHWEPEGGQEKLRDVQ